MSDRKLSQIMEEMRSCCAAWVPEAKLIGNVSADEIRRIVENYERMEEERDRLQKSDDKLAIIKSLFYRWAKNEMDDGDFENRVWKILNQDESEDEL